MGLKGHGDLVLALGDLSRERIGLVEEPVGAVVLERLRGQLFAVHQDVEDAPAGIAAPVGHAQLLGPIGEHLDDIAEPATVFGVSPPAVAEDASRQTFPPRACGPVRSVPRLG